MNIWSQIFWIFRIHWTFGPILGASLLVRNTWSWTTWRATGLSELVQARARVCARHGVSVPQCNIIHWRLNINGWILGFHQIFHWLREWAAVVHCTYMKKEGRGALPENEVLVPQVLLTGFQYEANRVLWGPLVSKQYISCLGQSIFLDTPKTHTPPTECSLKVEWRSGNCGQCPHGFEKWLNFLWGLV